jgi:geranylgeranyl diphosphate synthase type II
MFNTPDYLIQKAHSVDEWLDRLLPTATVPPPIIHEAIRYSIFAGGKRLRPILTIATGEMFNAAEQELLPAACSLEMIHTYSLIHDDLPAMDNDTLRRGRPTNHVVFGEAMAILAGDALLTQAFRTLADTQFSDTTRQIKVIAELAQAAGTVQALIGGQVMDIQAEGHFVSGEQLEAIHRAKTGALIRCAVRVGAIIGGASDFELHALTQYSEKAGLAFQIADDVLDATGTSTELGKTAGKDASVQKATYISLYGIDGATQRAQQLCREAVSALDLLPLATDRLNALASFIVERKS